jgi:hypothetical protein
VGGGGGQPGGAHRRRERWAGGARQRAEGRRLDLKRVGAGARVGHTGEGGLIVLTSVGPAHGRQKIM